MMSVCAILDAIKAGTLSRRDAVAMSVAAVAAGDPAIRAFVALADAERLMSDAEAASGPLGGIAVGVKDIFDTCDMPTGHGSPIFAGNRPRHDAAIVAMMRARGAAIIGKTATTEYAFFSPAKTVNPHDLARTPGGSSSGSAAAVAAGMIPAALGTQTGGSVVRPAAFCGVAGYKPSFRLVPMVGAKCFSWTLDTGGFFAAGVRDVARFAGLALGRDLDADDAGDGLRVGLWQSPVDGEMSDAMAAALHEAADRLSRAGATIITMVEPEALMRAREAHSTVQNFEAGLACAGEYAIDRERMSPILRETLEQGMAIRPEAYDEARRAARHGRKATHAVFDTVDIILAPSAPGIAPLGHSATGSPVFNKLWTLTGLPCINVPAMTDPETGMPLGLQVIGRFGRDKATLGHAAFVEAALTR